MNESNAALSLNTAPAKIASFRRYQHLASEGEPQNTIFRMEDGWACGYHLMSDGRRQITSLFLPGEYCEPQWVLGARPAHPVIAMTNVRVRAIPIDQLRAGPNPCDDMRAMLSAVLVTLNRQAEWIVNLGRKSAMERVSGLVCELFDRLRVHGRVVGNTCTLPLTQYEIADIVGLTPVHVNRVLQSLRSEGLLELSGKRLRLPDPNALRRIAAVSRKTSDLGGHQLEAHG